MFQGKARKIVLALMLLYTILTLYFLYLGFNRATSNLGEGLRYNLVFEGIPLHFPMGRGFQIWIFDLGNFLAFVPFGLIIPLLYRCNFIRFIGGFILSISVLELIQMLSGLGAFDINDIFINTLGAAVGYGAQKTVTKHRYTFKGMFRMILSAIVISVSTIVIVGSINQYLDHGGGDIVPLHELNIVEGTVLWDEDLAAFTSSESKVEPQINLYSYENTNNNVFTFLLDGRYTRMDGNYAIPDAAVDSSGSNEISFIADGDIIYSLNFGNESPPDTFHIPMQGVDELTISLSNNGPNSLTIPVMWDITLTEVNIGQKMINTIKSWFK